MSIKEQQPLSTQAISRMPYYLQYLKKLYAEGQTIVSAPAIALHFRSTEIQVRKDFAAVSPTHGKPKQGFDLRELIGNMERVLGYHTLNRAALAGVGSLGKALLSYRWFDTYGLHIEAAFDEDEKIIGSTVNGKTVLSAEKIELFCKDNDIPIGIIAVPEEAAQTVCNAFVAGGVQAIWNFAPIYLMVPEQILVQNENMAASLALLSKHLQERDGENNLDC